MYQLYQQKKKEKRKKKKEKRKRSLLISKMDLYVEDYVFVINVA
jgi:hypothetical protein